MLQAAKYVYCIITCQGDRSFDAAPVGGNGGQVYTICHEGLGLVVSDSAKTSYESTRSNMIAHQRVLETVMQESTLLPVRFGTVADAASPVESIHRLLHSRHDEFSQLLGDMEGKAEMGLKAFWMEEKSIYDEIVAESPEIRRLRHLLAAKPPEVARFEGVALGRMVKEALDRKRSQEAAKLLAPLRPIADRLQENNTLMDRMILNAAFLIQKSRGLEFDQAVEKLDEEHSSRIGLKYVGPIPPYNFVDIVVNWEDPGQPGPQG